jgi:hypothetical protein
MERTYKVVLLNLITRPLKAFATIYSYDLYKHSYPFLVVIGIAQYINRHQFKLADTRKNLLGPLIMDIGLGAIFGWMGVAIFSWLIYATGTWFKGRTTSSEMFNITSYAALPSVLTLISSLTCIIILRNAGYTDDSYPHVWGNFYYQVIKVNYAINIMANIYYFFLMVLAVSVAQGFTIGKAVLNVISGIGVVIVPLGILLLLLRY